MNLRTSFFFYIPVIPVLKRIWINCSLNISVALMRKGMKAIQQLCDSCGQELIITVHFTKLLTNSFLSSFEILAVRYELRNFIT